jgi:2,4-diketo-3-deoxy-L-fuconate hydrolase
MELIPDEVTGHEVELALIIGRKAYQVSEEEALSYVAGYVIGLDMTVQNDRLYSYNKAPDGYGVLGPWMLTADEIPDPAALTFQFWIDGELRQTGEFKNLVYSMGRLVSAASQQMTLHPGDVMYSGTRGVMPVLPGETMVTEINPIGRMTVHTRARAA